MGHPGNLSNVGLSMFLADIVLLLKKIRQPFQVVQEAKVSFSDVTSLKAQEYGCSHSKSPSGWLMLVIGGIMSIVRCNICPLLLKKLM